MYKKLVMIFGLVLGVIVMSMPGWAHSGGQAYAVKTDEEIIIDGDISDSAWVKAIPVYVSDDLVPAWQKYMTHVSWGTLPEGSRDFSFMAYFMWDDSNFYVAVKVNDDKIIGDKELFYENDCVELFFDPAHEGQSFTQKYFGLKKADSAEPFTNFPGAVMAFLENDMLPPFGYSLEVAIPWSVMNSELKMAKPSVGTTIGFDIQADDADVEGEGRKYALVWSGGENKNWVDASVYGDLTFVEAK